MRDPLDGVALFVEVVHAGGFARAAEQLSLTRSAVGKAIGRVEERLGVRLFHRTTWTQSLTEAGQVYYEHCLRALEEVRSAQSLLESGQQEITGRLRVTMPVLFGQYCAGPILLEQARQHPKLELELHFSDQSVDLIAEGFDLAIRFGPWRNSAAYVHNIWRSSKNCYAHHPVTWPKTGSPAVLQNCSATTRCCITGAITRSPGPLRTPMANSRRCPFPRVFV